MLNFRILFRVLVSNLALTGRCIIGGKISYKVKNLVSPFASLRTFGMGKIKLGYKTEIRPNTEITAREGVVELGNNCFINRNCMIVSHDHILMGERVTIGPGTVIYDHDHDGKGGYITKSVEIKDNAWIGANVVILKGVTIGKNAVIAAGSIISNDVPDNVKIYQKRQSTMKRKNNDV